MENNRTIEELFCIKYELDSLAEITLKNESERMLPNFCSSLIENDHRDRYKLVCQYSPNCDVLDIACGVGYGSKMMAKEGNARTVLGCDLNQDAVRYARHRQTHENLEFKVANAEVFLNENAYDLIVSFETIEHLPNPHNFLDNVRENLKKDGLFIVSTPISAVELDTNPSNPYHIQEWGFLQFQEEISQFFNIQKIYLQMYQNAFLNEQIRKAYQERKFSAWGKLKNKIKMKLNLRRIPDTPLLFNNWYDKRNFTKIEEYIGQYDVCDLGQKYVGYQILICNKL
jgi:2-polyprenyl-3-methyl-5-hydroxy-6-metoxy-1,4-benzoquinol methylase